MTALLVALAGAAGACARLLTGHVLGGRGRRWPTATLAVNLSGSFALGVLLGSGPTEAVTTVLGTGFLGAFTTFSTFAADTVRLFEDGDRATAVGYVVASVAGGVVAAAVGIAVMA